MKIRDGYILNQIGDENMVVAVGEEALRFNGVMKLNSTGVFLWKLLEASSTRQALVRELEEQYEITTEMASQDVDAFLEVLQKAGMLTE